MPVILAWLAPYLLRIVAGSIVIAALGGGILYFKIHYEHAGRDKAIAAIAAKDKEALDAVKRATQNVDDCYAGNGTWDVTRGVCSR